MYKDPVDDVTGSQEASSWPPAPLFDHTEPVQRLQSVAPRLRANYLLALPLFALISSISGAIAAALLYCLVPYWFEDNIIQDSGRHWWVYTAGASNALYVGLEACVLQLLFNRRSYQTTHSTIANSFQSCLTVIAVAIITGLTEMSVADLFPQQYPLADTTATVIERSSNGFFYGIMHFLFLTPILALLVQKSLSRVRAKTIVEHIDS
jgi:hypothetical protein